MSVKISAITIGSISVDVDKLKSLGGMEVFQITDQKSCDEIINTVAADDIVFILSKGGEVYYAEKFFSRLPALKIYIVTESQAAENKNLRDAIIQIPEKDFSQSVYEIIEGIRDFEVINLKTMLKNSGKAVAMVSISNSLEDAADELLSKYENEFKTARIILVTIFGAAKSLSMFAVSDVTEKIQDAVRKDAEIIWKINSDETYGDKVKLGITVGRFIA